MTILKQFVALKLRVCLPSFTAVVPKLFGDKTHFQNFKKFPLPDICIIWWKVSNYLLNHIFLIFGELPAVWEPMLYWMIQVHPTLFPDRVLKIELPGKNYPDISFERKEGHEKFYWNISVSPSVPVFISVDERRNWASSPVLNGWNKFLGICNCIQREPLGFSFSIVFNLSNKICLLFWKQAWKFFSSCNKLNSRIKSI